MYKIFIPIVITLLLAATLYYRWHDVLGICLGITWGLLNLYFIKQLLQSVLIPNKRNFLKIFVFILIKFPLLYFLGYGLLLIPYFSPWSLLIGFSLILILSTQNWFWKIQQKLHSSSDNPA